MLASSRNHCEHEQEPRRNLHLTDVDEDAIVAFLTILSDGYFSRDTP